MLQGAIHKTRRQLGEGKGQLSLKFANEQK